MHIIKQPTTNNQQRNIVVDIAKGLGIYFVFFGHLVQYGSPVFNWVFSFHMPLFFFLAGLVFKYDIDNDIGKYKYYFYKIFSSLIIPYFLFVLTGLLFCYVIIPDWKPYSIKRVLIEVFYFVQPEILHFGQIWFLFCLAMVQILFIVLKQLRFNIATEYAIVVLLSMVSFFYGIFLRKYLNTFTIPFTDFPYQRLPLKLDTSFMALLFFYAGYEINRYKVLNKLNNISLSVKLLLLFSCLLINMDTGMIKNGFVNISMISYGDPILYLISSLSGIGFILFLSLIINKNRFIEYFGKYSLSIFSFHSLFLFLYVSAISYIFDTRFYIMDNIPILLCLIGTLSIIIMSLPIPTIYKNTLGLIQKKLIKKIQ